MATADRMLQLLALLAARAWWSGAELAERLETTERTVRRDVNRLRDAGYPVVAVSGPNGGYRLGSGARLPPLVLDDDEAVAVALSLRRLAGRGAGATDAALSALVKLEQVLPPRLREQVSALGTVTVGLHDRPVPDGEGAVLAGAALACRRNEWLRFSYRAGSGAVTDRRVEPYRLVFSEDRWYLVAFDPDRDDWRTFRLDRMSELRAGPGRFTPREQPDAAELVSQGIAAAPWALRATVRLHLSLEDARRVVPRAIGLLTEEGAGTTILSAGADTDEWIARWLCRLPCRFEVLDPPSTRAAVRQLAAVLATDHADGQPAVGLP